MVLNTEDQHLNVPSQTQGSICHLKPRKDLHVLYGTIQTPPQNNQRQCLGCKTFAFFFSQVYEEDFNVRKVSG